MNDVLAGHPDVGFISNLDERFRMLRPLGRWNNSIYRASRPRRPSAHTPVTIPTRLGRAAVSWAHQRCAPNEAWRSLDDRVSPVIANPFRDLTNEDATPWLAGEFRAFFSARATAQAKPVFLHKFTGWPRAGFVEAALPGTKFIHVVRDGRSVANSLLQMRWWPGYRGPAGWGLGPLPEGYQAEWEAAGRSFVALAGIQWKLLLDAFEDARTAIPEDRWLDVRYEDFAADPRDTAQMVMRFLGLEWDPRFEQHLASIPVHAAREDFRRHLSSRDTDALDSLLTEHLARWGYLKQPSDVR
jgi:hypothetical protein